MRLWLLRRADEPPLHPGCRSVVLDEGRADEGSNDATDVAAGVGL
jgi:hypothetical protein